MSNNASQAGVVVATLIVCFFGYGAYSIYDCSRSVSSAMNKQEDNATPASSADPLASAAQALAVAGESADSARDTAKHDLASRKPLFAVPTSATCTKIDGDKLLVGLRELRADAVRCGQRPAASLDPACMQLLSASFAHVDWVIKQINTLPIPPVAPGSSDKAVDTFDISDDLKTCCSCIATARASCAPAEARIDKASQAVRAWETRVGAKNDDECVMSDLQMPMMHL